MTKEFDKAKAHTLKRGRKVLEAINTIKWEASTDCAFCRIYYCDNCPIYELCKGEVLRKFWHTLDDLKEISIKGLILVEQLEEGGE